MPSANQRFRQVETSPLGIQNKQIEINEMKYRMVNCWREIWDSLLRRDILVEGTLKISQALEKQRHSPRLEHVWFLILS